MLLAPEHRWPEQQFVHRLFTIRWTHGCVYTRLHGTVLDDQETRWQIQAWAQLLAEILPKLEGEFVTILDTTALGSIPRGLLFELVKLTRSMARAPVRRALIAAEGGTGDNQAEAAQLVTAGSVRVFRPMQWSAAIDWLAEAGTIDAYCLRQFAS